MPSDAASLMASSTNIKNKNLLSGEEIAFQTFEKFKIKLHLASTNFLQSKDQPPKPTLQVIQNYIYIYIYIYIIIT